MKPLLYICLLFGALHVQAQYGVGNFSATYNDASRSRNVPTQVFYPTTGGNPATGQFPVIVFGHGFVMAYSAYQNLVDTWVPMGYIMAFPTTEGSLFPTPSHSAFAADLNFLVTQMQSENSNASSDLFGIVSPNTALMGHSMGGGCSFVAASTNTTIKTVIGLAPAETNPSAITAAASVVVPTLVLSGSSDGVTPAADNHLPMYTASQGDCKAFVSITGGAHCYFANSNFNCDFGEGTSSTGISITRTEQQEITYDYVTPWLDYYLKGDCAAFAEFSDSIAATSSRVVAQSVCELNPVPDINLQTNIFNTNTQGTAYQWLENGVDINGADQSSYTATQSGVYSVEVAFANGCTRLSDTLSYTTPLSNDVIINTLEPKIYAAKNVLYWDNLPADAQLQLFDLNGRELAVFTPAISQGNLRLPVLPAGLYVLHLQQEKMRYNFKVHIEAN